MRILFVLLLAFAAAPGRVIIVPDSAATIQAGLASAGAGDTVLVRPGTYTENISWPSIDGIKLYSQSGPESTVVDGNYAGTCLVMASGGLTRATEVRGLKFANGFTAGGGAAGIQLNGSATIAGNRITRCHGVGIYLSGSSSLFKPLVIANEVDGCWKEVENYNYGCGVYIGSSSGARPEVCWNYIHHDTLRNSSRNYGGGVFIDGEALVYGNVVEANVLYSDTGSACRAHGAGIYVDAYSLVFNNLIINNRCATDAWKYGAGIKVNLGADAVIVNNTIVGNVCEPHMWSDGGGIYNDMMCTTYVKHNIVADNQASDGAGVFNSTIGTAGVVISSYNDYYNNALSGCAPGQGDIAADPLFATGPRGSYYLSQAAAGQPSTSPCVDAGDTLLPVLETDIAALLRAMTTRTDSVPDVAALDMGFHVPTPLQVGLAAPYTRYLPLGADAGPNPARGVVRFTAGPVGREPLRLVVTDALGRIVHRAEVSGRGTVRLEWAGRDCPAGVYLWRVSSEGREATGRLVKVQ